MSYRFDNRTKDTFKKDIKFGTMLEKYFFHEWLARIKNSDSIIVESWGDNGCDNNGEFIAKGSTAGADYWITGSLGEYGFNNEPLEMKWVPTAGKFTLKEGDLKAYIRERASILFIYNSVQCGTDLRKPKDYDFAKHIRLIESKESQLKWAIMLAPDVKDFYEINKQKGNVKPIRYMGNKPGIVLQEEDYYSWFQEFPWQVRI